MLPTAIDYQVRINDIRFTPSLELGGCNASIRGFLKPNAAGKIFFFSLIAQFDTIKKLWGINLQSLRWASPVPKLFFDLRTLESIGKAVVSGFRLLWMQPVPGSSEGGAQIRVGQTIMTEDQGRDAFLIVRGDILSLYQLDWPRLWPAVENRLMHDPEFWISGFTRQDAVTAVAILKNVFPWEWVRRRYQNTEKKRLAVGMWDVMQADQGFPAYHLARTAIGCICKDPGWNYLITLAESCKLLKSFPKGNSLLRRIATEPGHIHQANFSAFLLNRGLLAEIEPGTGSGNAKHDMAVRIGDVTFDIEMKAQTSSDPARQVSKEIAEKCGKLPSSPLRPVVFFILLVEKSVSGDHKSWPEQLSSITTDVFQRTTGVSSVVVGRMFIDSTGGPIKWSFDKFVINDHAQHRVDEQTLRLVFEPNWRQLAYPLLPIVFSYNLTDSNA